MLMRRCSSSSQQNSAAISNGLLLRTEANPKFHEEVLAAEDFLCI
jgi:hypothetical protein